MAQMSRIPTITLLGTARSAPIELINSTILRIWMPAAWDAASIGVEECESEDGTYQPTYDDEGEQYLITAAASRMIRVREANFQHARFVRFYSTNAQLSTRSLRVQIVLLRELIGSFN